MRILFRMTVAAAVLAATLVTAAVPALAAGNNTGSAHDTIAVTCSNGFQRTVSARASRGVAKALTKFNAHNKKGVTCSAAPGAPRVHTSKRVQKVLITCSNGFERKAPPKAAKAIVKALNAYSARKDLGVSCAIA